MRLFSKRYCQKYYSPTVNTPKEISDKIKGMNNGYIYESIKIKLNIGLDQVSYFIYLKIR